MISNRWRPGYLSIYRPGIYRVRIIVCGQHKQWCLPRRGVGTLEIKTQALKIISNNNWISRTHNVVTNRGKQMSNGPRCVLRQPACPRSFQGSLSGNGHISNCRRGSCRCLLRKVWSAETMMRAEVASETDWSVKLTTRRACCGSVRFGSPFIPRLSPLGYAIGEFSHPLQFLCALNPRKRRTFLHATVRERGRAHES